MADSHGRFIWYELMTTDMAAAKAFYAEVMGWRAQDVPIPGKDFALFIAARDWVSGVMHLPEDARRMGAKPGWIGYVAVDDVDAAAARVAQLGGIVHIPPTDIPDISRFAIVADPQAAMFALFKGNKPLQRPQVEQGRGHVVWHELIGADAKAFAFYAEIFGWRKANADAGQMDDSYQLFSAGTQTLGGILGRSAAALVPFWLYYFSIGDIDAAAKRVTAGGGRIIDGPHGLGGDSAIVLCSDPQGATFALEGKGSRGAIGYFERVGSQTPAEARGRRWHW